jgi:uncharacterized protein YciI
MLFALICTDKPGSVELRMKMRPDHLAFLDSLGAAVKGAGPFTDDAGSPTGSLILVEAENRSAVETLAAGDPYAKAGLFSSVEIRPWKWVIKNPEAK